MDDDQDTAASWRYWTTFIARVRFGKQQVAGKTLTAMTIKAVAERVAGYADHKTGARVRPGIARIAVDMESSYTTVRNAITVLERVGLLQLVSPGTRRSAAVYQLAIPTDLLERDDVELWSPSRHTLEIQRVADSYRGRSQVDETLTPQESALLDRTLTPTGSAFTEDDLPNADAVGTEKPSNADAVGTETLTPTASAITQRPIHNYDHPPREDHRRELTPSRASPSTDPPMSTVDAAKADARDKIANARRNHRRRS